MIEGEEKCTASTAQEDVITVPQKKLRASGKLQYEIRKGADHLPNYVLHVCSNALWDACGLFDVVNQINRTTHVHTVSSQFRAIFGWSHMVYFLARVGTHWSLSDIWRPCQFSPQHWRQRSKHVGDKTILQAASFKKELTRDLEEYSKKDRETRSRGQRVRRPSFFVTPVGQPAELKRKGENALDRCDVLTVCAAMHGLLYLSPYCHCTFNADISWCWYYY